MKMKEKEVLRYSPLVLLVNVRWNQGSVQYMVRNLAKVR